MIHAYNELYVNDAKRNLAVTIDYLSNYCRLPYKDVQNILCESKYLKQFCIGNPLYISGMSGEELAKLVASEFMDVSNLPIYEESFEKSPEYWVGWVLAEYSWYSFKDFQRIFYAVDFEKILKMYPTYHEMDIARFVERMEVLVKKGTLKTNLRIIRELNNLSQSMLAKESGVSLRSIQLYEQRVNDIDKAQSHTLFKLAKILHCSIEDLLENPQNDL
ncbi:MAG: helix-turn-helix domain-containing protein [Bacilli bacterium]|nr:helix-turn-helix domain-containing protein [Bacilli bacterium]